MHAAHCSFRKYLESLWSSLTGLLGRVAPSSWYMNTSIVDKDVERFVLGQELVHELADVVKLSYIKLHGCHIVGPEVLVDGILGPAQGNKLRHTRSAEPQISGICKLATHEYNPMVPVS